MAIKILKQVGFYLLVLFYVLAGINHFRDPGFYEPLIPPYFPFPEAINLIVGVIELVLGLGLLWKPVRTYAIYGIILLLVAFIPAHVYMIQVDGCVGVEGSLCVSPLFAWVRLFPLQFLLMWWAYRYRDYGA